MRPFGSIMKPVPIPCWSVTAPRSGSKLTVLATMETTAGEALSTTSITADSSTVRIVVPPSEFEIRVVDEEGLRNSGIDSLNGKF